MSGGSEGDRPLCQQCGTETMIKRTVPWQPDICTVCGANVPGDD